jgi:hypothetical protein
LCRPEITVFRLTNGSENGTVEAAHVNGLPSSSS